MNDIPISSVEAPMTVEEIERQQWSYYLNGGDHPSYWSSWWMEM